MWFFLSGFLTPDDKFSFEIKLRQWTALVSLPAPSVAGVFAVLGRTYSCLSPLLSASRCREKGKG